MISMLSMFLELPYNIFNVYFYDNKVFNANVLTGKFRFLVNKNSQQMQNSFKG